MSSFQASCNPYQRQDVTSRNKQGVYRFINLYTDMEIKGKVHCFFEQSGTFKNEFIKLGIPAEDYDIQNNFGQTDHKIDFFHEIDEAYRGGQVSLIQ